MKYIPRYIDQNEIHKRIKSFPVTAILGPRQCGKTRLARSIEFDHYFALECLCKKMKKNDNEYYFYQVHSGTELDLFWQQKGKNWGVEFKYVDAPRKTRSMTTAIRDLDLEHLWIVYPGKTTYKLSENITVISLSDWLMPKGDARL